MWLIVTGSAVAAADTISAPWTPTSSGPPPDANGSGSDTKNLDVGEISDVSSIFFSIIFESYNLFFYLEYFFLSSFAAKDAILRFCWYNLKIAFLLKLLLKLKNLIWHFDITIFLIVYIFINVIVNYIMIYNNVRLNISR